MVSEQPVAVFDLGLGLAVDAGAAAPAAQEVLGLVTLDARVKHYHVTLFTEKVPNERFHSSHH